MAQSGHSRHCNILSAIGIRADIEQPLLTVPWLLPVECTNRPTLVPIRPRVGARKTHTAASGRMRAQLRRLRSIIFS